MEPIRDSTPRGRRGHQDGQARDSRRHTFSKRIPKINPKPKKKPTSIRSNQTKKIPPPTHPKKTRLEGGGEEDKTQEKKRSCRISPSVFQLQGCNIAPQPPHPPTLKLQHGWRDGQTSYELPPPLVLHPPPSSALWSWMELNANDLTELKSSTTKKKKKSVFIFLLVGSDCFLSAVSLDAVFCTVLQCLLLIWNNVLAYLLQELLIFFVVVLEIFIRWLGKKKKYCENLASRFLLLEEETDCPGETKDTRKSQKRRGGKEPLPPTTSFPLKKPNQIVNLSKQRGRGGVLSAGGRGSKSARPRPKRACFGGVFLTAKGGSSLKEEGATPRPQSRRSMLRKGPSADNSKERLVPSAPEEENSRESFHQPNDSCWICTGKVNR